jgi:CheY-like chemotaxis protein
MRTHVLLIDDDEDELLIFKDALADCRIPAKCTWAKSGEHALKILPFLRPDIIFVDFNMPGMNGLTCIAAIRDLQYFKNVPLILYSTVITPEMNRQPETRGAYSCLKKTADAALLSEQLKHLLIFPPHVTSEAI